VGFARGAAAAACAVIAVAAVAPETERALTTDDPQSRVLRCDPAVPGQFARRRPGAVPTLPSCP
jgi:hypothetical protein